MKIIQGDIIFIEVEEDLEKAKKLNDGVIAEGEMTGHFHRIIQTKVKERTDLEELTEGVVYEKEGKMYVKAGTKTAVKHNEHKTVVLPKGTWKVLRTREYTPRGWRQVID